MGSLSGIPTGSGPLTVEASEGESNRSCSTDLIPGVWGVMGVTGVWGTAKSLLEAESMVRSEAWSALSSGVGGDRPS